MKDIFLNQKEAVRVAVVEAVLAGEKTAVQGARRIKVTDRQMFRILDRVKRDGIGWF